MTSGWLEAFHKAGISARTNEPFSNHLPLRTEGKALAWVRIKDLDQLKLVTQRCRKEKKQWKVHWPMESWLTKGDWKRVVLRLTGTYSNVSFHKQSLTIGTAVLWGELSSFPQWGRDFQHWPGSVGGLFQSKQQSLLKGYSGNIEFYQGRSVKVLDWDEKTDPPELPKSAIPLKLTLNLGRRRRRKNPPAAGDVFKCNSLNLADAFQVAGLLGTRLYGWQLTDMAPGQIVHTRRDNSAQFLLLYKGLKERLKVLKNIELELQVPTYGGGRNAK